MGSGLQSIKNRRDLSKGWEGVVTYCVTAPFIICDISVVYGDFYKRLA